ncbi:agamous-like MADS-box protein AGL104 [Solanum tuberosum]|uniref:agamous-like MADS-box protein AGL104 n=1 Tax=Solanum tuberosum TaxID=4113 RepID=UPI00073A4A97|nr:PREDICTED: agamous-like MADS-box protein AGL104 [Solanum tuberosum]
MGRKIEIKKIEETTKRQVTFSKRRSSLLKKAEEIAICCDVDMLFVAFSPSGRLNKFCSQQRVEDMLQRYLNLPVERRLTYMNIS